MIRSSVAFALAAVAAWNPGPARAADAAAFERALFRTVTLLYATAPRETVAAATRCMVDATKAFPDSFRQAVIAVDRRPVYRGSDRMSEISRALATYERGTVAPLSACFDRLAEDAFGPTRGAVPATAAPNPDDVAACPIYLDAVGDELTCYCQPMLGGIAYGDRTYADASSICLASRHAGATDYLTGGVVTATFRPGCAAYEGVEANGALSAATGRTARSFHFPSVGEGKCPQ